MNASEWNEKRMVEGRNSTPVDNLKSLIDNKKTRVLYALCCTWENVGRIRNISFFQIYVSYQNAKYQLTETEEKWRMEGDEKKFSASVSRSN